MNRNSENQSPLADDRRTALTALALVGGRREACPDDSELLAWQERRLPVEDAARIEAHVADCTRCFRLWQDLQAVAAEDPRTASARATGRPSGLFGWLPRPMGVAAIAAAFALVMVGGVLLQGPKLTPLPAYEISLQGRAVVRGESSAEADGTVVEFAPGMRWELVLRPETAIEDELELQAWALAPEGEPVRLPATATYTPRGAVQVEGTVDDQWPLAPGEGALLVVLGRQDRLPAAPELLQRLGEDQRMSTRDWNVWRLAIRTLP